MLPEDSANDHVIVLLIRRSAIGVTLTTADVKTEANAVSLAPKMFTARAGNVRLLVVILPVRDMVAVLHELIKKIGSCSAPRESNALLIGVIEAL